MNTATITHKRERRKYAERLEIKAECPLCGHTAILVISGDEKEYNVPIGSVPTARTSPMNNNRT